MSLGFGEPPSASESEGERGRKKDGEVCMFDGNYTPMVRSNVALIFRKVDVVMLSH
jgi:hypothetical protein